MFPLVAIGGIIGAVMSVAKGASWLADQLDSTKGTGSTGGKAQPTALTETQASAFAATLAAQTTGQSVPVSPAAASAAPAVMQLNGTDYGELARMQAGAVAYSRIGAHHGNHAGAVKQPDPNDSTTVAQS